MTTSNQNPLSYLGVTTYDVNNVISPVQATRVPTSLDDNYKIGQMWINTSTGASYQLTNFTAGVPTWAILGGGSADVNTINGLSPTGGNITIAGTGSQISVANAGSTVTLSIPAVGANATSWTTGSFITSSATTGTTFTANSITPTGTDANINLLVNGKGTGGVIHSRGLVAGDITIESTNTDNTNGASRAGVEVATGGAAGGDPYVNFLVSGAGQYTMGIDNSDSDNFKLAASAALGTTDIVTITSAGAMTTAAGITATTGNIVSTAGNVSATVGAVSAGTTVTAGTGITATTGNITASTGNIIATLGDIEATVGNVTAQEGNFSNMNLTFADSPVLQSAATTGAAPSGATGDTNLMAIEKGLIMEQFILGAGQTIIAPRMSATGLLTSLDLTNAEGAEYNFGAARNNSKFAFTIGTSAAFFIELQVNAADIGGLDPFMVGFRKVQANDATLANYTDFATIGAHATTAADVVVIQTNLNGGGVAPTNTTDAWTDGQTKTLRVNVSAAGVVTYTINGVAPTVTAAFTFDNGDVVVPFIRHLFGAATPAAINWIQLRIGFQ